MAGYQPLYIQGNKTGLVQEREEFILPTDAYPILENAFVWRERIKRKQAYELLGRLRRVLTGQALENTDGSGNFSGNILAIFSLEATAEIQVGSVVVSDGTNIFTDNSLGVLVGVPGGTGTINYVTGAITITGGAAASPLTIAFNYYPGLPVMGIRTRDLVGANSEMTVFFDTKYAYNFAASGFVEFITGTTWSSALTNANSNFFWTTNYWITPGAAGKKVFWATNFSGPTGDPIRYTNGTGNNTGAWINFAPQINAAVDRLTQCLALLAFRGRLVAFNTLEGANLATSVAYTNRIRWAAIGNPISDTSALFPAPGDVNINAWRDDIRGQGGFLDIPTNEDIITVGFVRDNLVIYCESSTWQLRYTGRTIAPFQIEKVNTELGAGSTFSAVQFDTSLVGIGDKGIVECDSYKSELIDIKIPDLVINHINSSNFGQKRVHGIRDFVQRLAYWTYPETDSNGTFPDRRLVYNYENDSWAIFTDSLTTLGTFQPVSNRTWANPTGGNPQNKLPWNKANFPWVNRPASILAIVGGNQQGYVEFLDEQTTNDESLTVTAITGNTTTPTVITSANHNMQTGYVVGISGIPLGTPFSNTLNNPLQGLITGATQANPCQITSSLNHNLSTGASVEISGVVGMTQLNGGLYTITVTGATTFTLDNVNSTAFTAYSSGGTWTDQAVNVFGVIVTGVNTFQLMKYDPITKEFSDPQLDAPATYIGGGQISVRDNFRIVSKKFNFLDQGQNIQIGYIDVLMDTDENGAISLNVYINYDDNDPSNTQLSDTFFNVTIPLSSSPLGTTNSSKTNHRVFCPTRGNYLTLEYTLSNAQMNGEDQGSDVQIDMQVIWQRPAGRIGNI